MRARRPWAYLYNSLRMIFGHCSNICPLSVTSCVLLLWHSGMIDCLPLPPLYKSEGTLSLCCCQFVIGWNIISYVHQSLFFTTLIVKNTNFRLDLLVHNRFDSRRGLVLAPEHSKKSENILDKNDDLIWTMVKILVSTSWIDDNKWQWIECAGDFLESSHQINRMRWWLAIRF